MDATDHNGLRRSRSVLVDSQEVEYTCSYVHGNSLSHSEALVQLPISTALVSVGLQHKQQHAMSLELNWRNWSPTYKDNRLAPEMDGASYAACMVNGCKPG